jgi:hypothetical protein
VNEFGYVWNPVGWVEPFGLSVQEGDVGAFGTLNGDTGDDLTPHHMPQDALHFLPRDDGGAIVITHDEHKQTRTYFSKGKITKQNDLGRP